MCVSFYCILFFNCLVFQASLPPLRSKGVGAIWPPLPPRRLFGSKQRARTYIFTGGRRGGAKGGSFQVSKWAFFLPILLSIPPFPLTDAVSLAAYACQAAGGKRGNKRKGPGRKSLLPVFSLRFPRPPAHFTFFCRRLPPRPSSFVLLHTFLFPSSSLKYVCPPPKARGEGRAHQQQQSPYSFCPYEEEECLLKKGGGGPPNTHSSPTWRRLLSSSSPSLLYQQQMTQFGMETHTSFFLLFRVFLELEGGTNRECLSHFAGDITETAFFAPPL